MTKTTQVTPPAGNPSQDMFNLAFQAHQAGRLPEAEKLYRKILEHNPHHAETLSLLGMIAIDCNRHEAAEDLLRLAIAEKPDAASFHYTLGNILSARGKPGDAAASYKTALTLKPGAPDYLNNLGAALITLGHGDEALATLKKVLETDPGNFNAAYNLGVLFFKEKKYTDAIDYYRRALGVKPDAAHVHYDLGRALKETGDIAGAKDSFEKTLRHKPDHAEALLQIAQILREEKNFDAALDYYTRAAGIKPNGTAEANIGHLLHAKGRYDEALIHYERARRMMPDSFQILNNMGITYKSLGRNEDSINCYLQSLALAPDVAETLSNLGGAYKNLGRLEEAIDYGRRAAALAPDKSWVHSNLLLAMIYASFVSPEDLMAEAQEFGKNADNFLRRRKLVRDPDTERRLRIGYVTSDFTDHAVNYFFEPLLNTHDRSKFEIFAYANVEVEDNVTRRLRSEFDHWRDIKLMEDDDAADLIEKDMIDILVDISGHTRGNRLMVFARKPAPVQVTWLAYPGTTGLKAMDYRITDPYAEPPGMTEHLNTETLWRLPRIFCCYQAHESNPPVIDYPPFEDNGFVTFGCFNNFAKVTDPVLEAWGKIMALVPESRLMLEIAAIESPKIRKEIEERLRKFLPMDRVILEPRQKSNQFVLYNEIDIALDPFPCVGGTTSMDTLWMGVPLVTLAGRHFTSRMGVTILTNAGLPELIAHSMEEYIAIASDLAGSPEKIRCVRKGLREKVLASPLMDQRSFTRDMETAYREMWRKHCASQGK